MLFERPSAKKIVIVPSLAMKQWVVDAIVDHPRYGIAFGFDVELLQPALSRMNDLTGAPPSPFNRKLLVWKLYREILSILEENEQDPLFDPVRLYCQKNRETSSLLLAKQLSHLFVQYGEHAPEEMERIFEETPREFQAALWQRLFPRASSDRLLTPRVSTDVHLFGFSFLPREKQRYFKNLSLPVFHWLLSPCRLFWGDLLTAREKARLLKRVSSEELESLLDENNPLLSQNGRLGRDFVNRIEETASGEERFAVPKKAFEYAAYEEHLLSGVEEVEEEWTLLKAIQTDLTLLRNLSSEKIDFPKDSTIQIHSAPSPFREVQSLYDLLVQTLDEDRSLSPREIVVLVSDVALYEPYIRLIFQGEESLLKAQILEGSRSKTALARGLLDILNLAGSRFAKDQVLALFQEPLLLKKWELTEEDRIEFSRFLEEMKVKWGIDLNHRKSLFASDRLEETGSFEEASQRFLDELCWEGSASFAQAELIGKWISIFRGLSRDLAPMIEKRVLRISEWVDLVKNLCSSYFDLDSCPDETHFLYSLLRNIEVNSREAGDPPLEFQAFHTYLIEELEESGFTYEERGQQAVRFCSMLPMRAYPAKVVALLGLSQGVVPKSAALNSLDRFREYAPTGYKPSPTDFDRYLFLEALISARVRLYLFYTATQASPAPSVLIQELLHYMDEGYTIGGKTPSEVLSFIHPDVPFDPLYFSEKSAFRSYSQSRFKAAQALICKEKTKAPSFQFKKPKLLSELDVELLPDELSIQDLKSFLAHPIRAYMKEGIGVKSTSYEAQEVRWEDFEEEEYLWPKLTQNALKNGIEEALEEAEGKLPAHPFKEPVKQRYRAKLKELFSKLHLNGLKMEDLFSIEFLHGQNSLEIDELGNIKAPPIEVEYRGKALRISGLLPLVSKIGLIYPFERKPEEFIDGWVLHALPEGIVERNSHYLNGAVKVEATAPNWTLLFDHFLRAKLQPLPLLSKWVAPLLDRDARNLAGLLKSSIERDHFGKVDHAMRWLFRGNEVPKPEEIIEDWEPVCRALFNGEKES